MVDIGTDRPHAVHKTINVFSTEVTIPSNVGYVQARQIPVHLERIKDDNSLESTPSSSRPYLLETAENDILKLILWGGRIDKKSITNINVPSAASGVITIDNSTDDAIFNIEPENFGVRRETFYDADYRRERQDFIVDPLPRDKAGEEITGTMQVAVSGQITLNYYGAMSSSAVSWEDPNKKVGFVGGTIGVSENTGTGYVVSISGIEVGSTTLEVTGASIQKLDGSIITLEDTIEIQVVAP